MTRTARDDRRAIILVVTATSVTGWAWAIARVFDLAPAPVVHGLAAAFASLLAVLLSAGLALAAAEEITSVFDTRGWRDKVGAGRMGFGNPDLVENEGEVGLFGRAGKPLARLRRA